MPRVTASSMADIAFLLLVFFLVCTTIHEDKGIKVLLPPYTSTPTPTVISERNLLRIMLNPSGDVLVNGTPISAEKVRFNVIDFVSNPLRKSTSPADPRKAVISLATHEDAVYADYLAVYDQVLSAYTEMRNEESLAEYGVAYRSLTDAQKVRISKRLPITISEAE